MQAKINELETLTREQQTSLKETENINRNREEDEFRKNTEFSKLNALIEQKLELAEKELKDYKAKY